jgi:hypothetical protein
MKKKSLFFFLKSPLREPFVGDSHENYENWEVNCSYSFQKEILGLFAMKCLICFNINDEVVSVYRGFSMIGWRMMICDLKLRWMKRESYKRTTSEKVAHTRKKFDRDNFLLGYVDNFDHVIIVGIDREAFRVNDNSRKVIRKCIMMRERDS